jgi:hypothetical protein
MCWTPCWISSRVLICRSVFYSGVEIKVDPLVSSSTNQSAASAGTPNRRHANGNLGASIEVMLNRVSAQPQLSPEDLVRMFPLPEAEQWTKWLLTDAAY